MTVTDKKNKNSRNSIQARVAAVEVIRLPCAGKAERQVVPVATRTLAEALWDHSLYADGFGVDAPLSGGAIEQPRPNGRSIVGLRRRVATYQDGIRGEGAIARWTNGDPVLEPWFRWWCWYRPMRADSIQIGGVATLSVERTYHVRADGTLAPTERGPADVDDDWLRDPSTLDIAGNVPDAVDDWHPVPFGFAACERHCGEHPQTILWHDALSTVANYLRREVEQLDPWCERCGCDVDPVMYSRRCSLCGNDLVEFSGWGDEGDRENRDREWASALLVLEKRASHPGGWTQSPWYPLWWAAEKLAMPVASIITWAKGHHLEMAGAKYITDTAFWTIYQLRQADGIVSDESCAPSPVEVGTQTRRRTVKIGSVLGAGHGAAGLLILSKGPPATNGRTTWICRCLHCGDVTEPKRQDHLVSGHTRSCGCLQRRNRDAYSARVVSRAVRRRPEKN